MAGKKRIQEGQPQFSIKAPQIKSINIPGINNSHVLELIDIATL